MRTIRPQTTIINKTGIIADNPIPEEEFIPKELTLFIFRILLEYFLFEHHRLFQKIFYP